VIINKTDVQETSRHTIKYRRTNTAAPCARWIIYKPFSNACRRAC